ncbi:hypothetical protein RFI_09754, partial [Reticulomyxa filosa]
EKKERRKRREELFGEAVEHSDEELIEDNEQSENQEAAEANGNSKKRNLSRMRETETQQDESAEAAAGTGAGAGAVAVVGAAAGASVKRKYIPPQLRRLQEGVMGRSANTALDRQIQSYLNRLNETNLDWAVNGVMEANQSFTRNDVVESMCRGIIGALRGTEDSKGLQHIVLCMAAFVTGIHFQLGTLVGSSVIEKLCLECDRIMKDESEWENERKVAMISYLRLFAYLYLFGSLTPKFVVGLSLALITCCQQRKHLVGFALIHTLMKLCGVRLRNDSPIEFRDVIAAVMNWNKETATVSIAERVCYLFIYLFV